MGKISPQGISCKMLSTIAYKSWNCLEYDSALAIHDNDEFLTISRHIIISVSILTDRQYMGTKTTNPPFAQQPRDERLK
jgi:hypothetical protein